MALPARWKLFFGLAVIFLFNCINAQNPFRSFQYKYSFKPPYLAQKDGSVPFWGYTGNAIANEEMVRITPSLRSQKGQIWTSSPTNFDWWEIELVFRVTGRGRIGADGLALWYTESKGVEGPVFGSNDQWNGLGLFFDSFDNDNKHNNPFIMAMTNDGSLSYAHQLDGSTQQLAGCLRDFRNKPFPVRAKVEYYKNTLSVMFHNGMSNNEQDYEMCFRVENVVLPKNGYFGVTAATGGLADDHDALKFLAYSLQSPDLSVNTEDTRIAEDEREKLSKEYQEYQDKLQKQKDEYRQANPESVKTNEENPEEWFETDSQRELGQIFSGQSKMFDALRDIQRKMDDIVGRQERTISLMSAIQNNQVGMAQPVGGTGQVPITDTIRRHEVDTALANQREIVGAAREIKAYVTEIHQRSGTIIQNQSKQQQAVGSAQPIGYDHLQNSLNEIKEGINMVKRDISVTAQRLAAQPVASCPNQQCLSTTIFAVFMIIQMIIMIGYFIYRDTKEAQAKKFY